MANIQKHIAENNRIRKEEMGANIRAAGAKTRADIGAKDLPNRKDEKLSTMARKLKHVKNFESARKVKTSVILGRLAGQDK